jgi:MFS family permease
VGATMLMPNSLAILGQTFAGPAKGRAIGVWAATGAAAGSIGPVLSGCLQLWTQVVGKVRLLTAHKPARIWRERMSDHVVTTTSLAAEPNWPRSRSPAGRPWPAWGAASCIPR